MKKSSDKLHKKRQVERKKAQIELKDAILILTEWRNTESSYFEELRKHYDLTNYTIKPAKHSDCNSIINEATLIQKGKEYQEIWCVFDYDNNPNFNTAIQRWKREWIYIAYSNLCFEFWILLHFNDYTCWSWFNSSQELLDILRGSLPEWFKFDETKKINEELFNKMQLSQSEAIARAKRLDSEHWNKSYSQKNPNTTVYVLVEKMSTK